MFFPLMKVLDLDGFLELSYLPSNNWENRVKTELNVYLLWPEGNSWNVQLFGKIKYGEVLRVTTADVDVKVLKSGVCLFYPTTEVLVGPLESLPSKELWSSRIPEWRATTGFFNSDAQTSYQSEIFPLPPKANLLTFHPFIQFGEVINNLLVLNVTSDPKIQKGEISLFNSMDKSFVAKADISTNSLTTIPLDTYNFKPTDLPVFYSPNIAGIPFGLGIAKSGRMLSLEHTHPPASLVLHGDRRGVQGMIKKSWIEKLVKA
jgi:hypothetical protein